MIKQYHNHKLQTNPWRRREEEQHNNHEAHEDKLTKATSSSLPNKIIAKPELTQSNAQQNTERLQNPTTGATHFRCLLRLVLKQWLCATLIVNHVIYSFPSEKISCPKDKNICRY